MDDLVTANLINTVGLSDASEEEKEDFLKKAATIILSRLASRIEKELPEDKREEFFSVFSGEKPDEERLLFLRDHVPNFENMFIEETLQFKKEALEHA